MNEIQLKYGCNPNQKPSRIYMEDGSDLPVKVLNGKPGYINFLDAFNGWQLVKELKAATGLAAATSFKHVSPAGAAVGLPLTDTLAKIYWVDDLGELSHLHAHMQEQEVLTECHHSAISSHFQMYVTQTQHALSRERYQMVLSLLDTQMRLWNFFLQRRREITTSSR